MNFFPYDKFMMWLTWETELNFISYYENWRLPFIKMWTQILGEWKVEESLLVIFTQ